MKNKKIIVTDNVLKWTNQYKENTDFYLLFLNECTEHDEKSNIHSNTLYEHFKDWFKNNCPTDKIPTRIKFSIGIKNYKTFKNVRVNNKVTSGIAGLKFKN